jgi:hypothetical protein
MRTTTPIGASAPHARRRSQERPPGSPSRPLHDPVSCRVASSRPGVVVRELGAPPGRTPPRRPDTLRRLVGVREGVGSAPRLHRHAARWGGEERAEHQVDAGARSSGQVTMPVWLARASARADRRAARRQVATERDALCARSRWPSTRGAKGVAEPCVAVIIRHVRVAASATAPTAPPCARGSVCPDEVDARRTSERALEGVKTPITLRRRASAARPGRTVECSPPLHPPRRPRRRTPRARALSATPVLRVISIPSPRSTRSATEIERGRARRAARPSTCVLVASTAGVELDPALRDRSAGGWVVAYLDYKLDYPEPGDATVNLLLVHDALRDRGIGRTRGAATSRRRLTGSREARCSPASTAATRGPALLGGAGVYRFAIDARPVVEWYGEDGCLSGGVRCGA